MKLFIFLDKILSELLKIKLEMCIDREWKEAEHLRMNRDAILAYKLKW